MDISRAMRACGTCTEHFGTARLVAMTMIRVWTGVACVYLGGVKFMLLQTWPKRAELNPSSISTYHRISRITGSRYTTAGHQASSHTNVLS